MIPIVWLIISLTALKMPAAKAAVISLLLAIFLTITAFQLPVVDTLTGTLEGILGGLFPIVYINAAGYKAILLTVDALVSGYREANLRTNFAFPVPLDFFTRWRQGRRADGGPDVRVKRAKHRS